MAYTKTVDSSSVAGEGTSVKIRQISFGKMKQLHEQTKRIRKERRTEIKVELKGLSGPGADLVVELLKEELEELKADLSFEIGWSMLADNILEWDWVDESGAKLPLPTLEDHEVFELLNPDQLQFLGDAVYGNAAKQKK